MRDLVLAWLWFSSAGDVGLLVTFMSFSACRATLFVCRTVALVCAFNYSVFWSFRWVRNAVVEQQAVFLQWHLSVSYCGVIPLNMESLEEAVVVLCFVLIPCSSLHCARVFRRG